MMIRMIKIVNVFPDLLNMNSLQNNILVLW
jgi:hypothetical protein